jgi:hypothetical protein
MAEHAPRSRCRLVMNEHSFLVEDQKFIASIRCSECDDNAPLIRRAPHPLRVWKSVPLNARHADIKWSESLQAKIASLSATPGKKFRFPRRRSAMIGSPGSNWIVDRENGPE